MDATAQLSAALSGRYSIEREIGRGGMATVYLAQDVRHHRHVALKVLQPELAAALGAERFLAEIKTTANLQHPHILPLFDSGEAWSHPERSEGSAFLYYVMPFVEGETLRARLERGPLPIDDALLITREVLSALDYAHRAQVVHRDIKPENILLHDGHALVADFGISLAVHHASSPRMTQTGLSLGTPQYMSPEQAMGERQIDGRADIYATGAMLYEMLTGEPPFAGQTVQAIVAKLLTERPTPPSTLRDTVPANVEAAVLRALAKLPADRFATAKDFATALARESSQVERVQRVAPSSHSSRAPWVSAGIAAVAGVGIGIAVAMVWRRLPVAPDPVRFVIDMPQRMQLAQRLVERPFALSGDGRVIAFATAENSAVYVRPLNGLEATIVPKVSAPHEFELSPDGSWMAYTSEAGTLNKVRVGNGQVGSMPSVLADSGIDRNTWMAWTNGDHVVHATMNTTAWQLWSTSAEGTAPRELASGLLLKEPRLMLPSVLPDGKTLAVIANPPPGAPRTGEEMRLMPVDGGELTKIALPAANIVGYADGLLFYGDRNGRVLGVPFDLNKRRVIGSSVPLLENVAFTLRRGAYAMLGANGTLAYVSATALSRIDVVDDHGTRVETLPVEPRAYSNLEMSPDGKRLLLRAADYNHQDLWLYDVDARTTTRLTRSGNVYVERWMPDGKHIVFQSGGSGNGVFMMPADGGAATPIAGTQMLGAFNVSPDGRYLVGFVNRVSGPGMSFPAPMGAVPIAGGAPIPLLADETQPGVPDVSPDGRWMAYLSRETGRGEVYVRRFPGGEDKTQISFNGGASPYWSRDGKHLHYVGRDDAFRVVTLDMSGAKPRVVRNDSLFSDPTRRNWSSHPDEKHMVLLHDAGEGPRLVVVTNWLAEARSKVLGK